MYTDNHNETGTSHHMTTSHAPEVHLKETEFCTNCATPMDPTASICGSCGVPRLVARHYCWHCASPIETDQALCTSCGAGLHGNSGRAGNNGTITSKRIVAAALAFFCGALGVHRFYLGDTSGGLIRLGITLVLGVFTLGLSVAAMSVIGVIECVIYLTHSDADFIRTYQEGSRNWF